MNPEIKLFITGLEAGAMTADENRRANLALSIITHLEHVGDIVDSEKSGERRYNFCAA